MIKSSLKYLQILKLKVKTTNALNFGYIDHSSNESEIKSKSASLLRLDRLSKYLAQDGLIKQCLQARAGITKSHTLSSTF